MTTNTDYTKQADEFLASTGTTFRATAYADDRQTAPAWCADGNSGSRDYPHGIRYRITLAKGGNRIGFDYWDSIHNRENGIEADAYSVLGCLSSDAYCPASFDEFCDEYGYDNDSRKALATFKRCRKLAEKLMAFFTEDELAKLAEIQ